MARPRQFDEAEVIGKATDLFWAKGYRRTTPADLTRATGLSKSSLYNAFGNKQGLFLRALGAYLDQNMAFMSAGLNARPLPEALDWMVEQLIASSAAPEYGGMGRSCLVCTTAMDTEPGEDVIRERLAESRLAMSGVFRKRFERALIDGELPADKDPALLADFLFSANNGLMVLARAGATPGEMRAVAQLNVQTILT